MQPALGQAWGHKGTTGGASRAAGRGGGVLVFHSRVAMITLAASPYNEVAPNLRDLAPTLTTSAISGGSGGVAWWS